MNVSSGKAGRTRWRGRRPHVRGMVMNPIDHPMGGGQGKSKGGGGRHHPVSPWGQLAKGFKTRSKHKPSDRFILDRRKKKEEIICKRGSEEFENKKRNLFLDSWRPDSQLKFDFYGKIVE